ncbi:uncharacterized protein LOC131665867 [Phymastichus coffea]|uniref:uncharacterized protein LOC131665867 n=1 Tax=Phymastichus coffea TaxID=108790 RepID=UPI00273BA428|nr:uncharacterized protein LOC131665867 [Phymastichus coffea]XP_058794052.1 uncharacterized protein LOC131665867 [Phymastichus coffea]
MNDSFLEDLDLIPKSSNTPTNQSTQQFSNRYITTRKALSPSRNVSMKNECDNQGTKHDKIISSSSSNVPKLQVSRRSGSQEPRRSSGQEAKPLSSTPKSEKKNSGNEKLMRPIENQTKPDQKAISKVQDNKTTKDRKCSGSSGGSGKYLDSKENIRPSIDSCSSKENGSHADLKKDSNHRISDGHVKKSDILEKADPVMFLSAVKDLVSRYTEQETVKVLRAMQNLHINSQANLIKHLMMQTNDLVRELNLHKNFDNIKALVEENERMREDISILRARNEVLQKKIEETALIREENISLKLKLKELQQ